MIIPHRAQNVGTGGALSLSLGKIELIDDIMGRTSLLIFARYIRIFVILAHLFLCKLNTTVVVVSEA